MSSSEETRAVDAASADAGGSHTTDAPTESPIASVPVADAAVARDSVAASEAKPGATAEGGLSGQAAAASEAPEAVVSAPHGHRWQAGSRGGAAALEFVALPAPPSPPPAGSVVINVLATTATYTDLLVLRGVYRPTPALPTTPGYEGIGTVAAVGSGVAGLSPGDRVAFLPTNGCSSSWVCLPAEEVFKVRSDVPAEEAAAAVLTGVTAYQMLTRSSNGRLRPGARILVHGCTGGTGAMIVSLAKILGVRDGDIYGTCSARNLRAAAACGVVAFDYAKGSAASTFDFETAAAASAAAAPTTEPAALSTEAAVPAPAAPLPSAPAASAEGGAGSLAGTASPAPAPAPSPVSHRATAAAAVRALPADACWSKRVLAATGGAGVDLVFDAVVAGGYLSMDTACLARGGKVICYGLTNVSAPGTVSTASALCAFAAIGMQKAASLFSGKGCEFYNIKSRQQSSRGEFAADLAALIDLIADGRLRPLAAPGSRVWPFEQAKEALASIERNAHSGKQIVRVAAA